MPDMLTIKIPKPLSSISPNQSEGNIPINSLAAANAVLKTKEKKIETAIIALENAFTDLENYKLQIIDQAKQHIAKLAVQIAETVISHKLQQNDYNIEKLILEALDYSAEKTDVQIHLNPIDLDQVNLLLEKNAKSQLALFKFAADNTVSLGGCRITSSKGIVESSMQDRLARIAAALNVNTNSE
jgi:flagellar biosynthesis/type III secretory pathway protein FliH